jgi:HD-like signal output (HDOD) protein
VIRILFVNDDPALLEMYRTGLAHLSGRWRLRFAAGAAQALEEIAGEPVDAVAAAMRMAGMDGAQLLERVRAEHPEIVRFIVSTQLSWDDAHRAMPLAHQILNNPRDLATLVRSVERACSLVDRIDQPAVRRAIGAITGLPPLPRLFWQLAGEMDSPRASSASVAAIVEQDPAMTARILQVANSPLFGPSLAVRAVRDAVTRLGMHQLRSIVLMQALLQGTASPAEPAGFSLDALQEDSVRTAKLAAAMVGGVEDSKIAFSAGMLHHVGYFLFATAMRKEYEAIRQTAFKQGKPILQVESEQLGFDHAEAGGVMLALWGLPLPLIEAVAFHHHPAQGGETRFGPVAAVHVAAVMAGEAQGMPVQDDALDRAFLRRIGALEAVQRWRAGAPVRAF